MSSSIKLRLSWSYRWGERGTGWTCHCHRCGRPLVNTESEIMATRLGRITTSKYSIITILVMIGLIEVTRQYLDQQPKQRNNPVHSDFLSSVFPSTPRPAQNSSLFPSKLQSRSAPQRILLLAYARSGSSFTGELLSSSPSAAYYYEPLFRNLSCQQLTPETFTSQYYNYKTFHVCLLDFQSILSCCEL